MSLDSPGNTATLKSVTIVNPGADKCVDNGGENRNRYSFAVTV